MTCERTIRRWTPVSAVLLGSVISGCFNPDDSGIDSATDATDGTSMSTTAGPTSSTTMPTTSTTSTATTMTTSPSSSSTDATSTTDATTGETDGGSTGTMSNCPGGDPTPGEAPYILANILAAQDTDDVDLGDINGDGHLDLVNLSRVDGAVETFFGDGMGMFMSDGITVLDAMGFPDTVRLRAIADDTMDLVVHMEGPVEIYVVRGDGAGNWPTPQVYTGTYVRAIDIADFNGDDVLDLAYVGASELEVRLGMNTEALQGPAMYGTNVGNVLRAADITGDDVLDILTAQYNATELQIHSGDGDGTFTAQPTLVTGSAITGVDVGHVDGDDLLDLVVTTNDDLRVFNGQMGGGVSSTPGTIIDDAQFRVRVVDIDADGVDDLVTRGGDTIEIRFANGDGTFSSASTFTCPDLIRRFEFGDVNEDCIPDIVAALGVDQDVCLLLSDRD